MMMSRFRFRAATRWFPAAVCCLCLPLHAGGMGPEYKVDATAALVQALSASGHVTPTPSADKNFVVNTTPGSVAGGYGLPNPQIPPQAQYGLRITDGNAGGKKIKIAVIGGTHAREQAGSHLLEGFLRKLVDDSPEMRELRRRVEVYVYPQINPEGRYAYTLLGNPHGIERDAPSNPGGGAYDQDLNRVWHRPEGWPQMKAIQKILRKDTEGNVDLFFDFHARSFTRKELESRNPAESAKQVWVSGKAARSVYIHYLIRRDPEIEVVEKKERKLPQTGSAWAASEKGLNATWSIVPECARDEPVRFYHQLGEAYALALFDWLNAPLP